jgi:hypothetical protein
MEAVVMEEVLIQSLAVLNHYVMKMTLQSAWLIASEEATGFEFKILEKLWLMHLTGI